MTREHVGALGIVSICVMAVVGIVQSAPGDLGAAQAKFESTRTWPTQAEFDDWRGTGAMQCEDHKRLRICRISWSRFQDGKPIGKDRATLACSPDECAWVDP